MPTPTTVSSKYILDATNIEQFPNVTFTPRSEGGALHSFMNPGLAYNLVIRQHFTHDGKTYYIVEQVNKQRGKLSIPRYALVNDKGECVGIKPGQNPAEKVFFVDYEFNGVNNIRVQLSKESIFEEVKLDLPAPQQQNNTQQVAQNTAPQSAPVAYNRMALATRIHIEAARKSFKAAIKQINDAKDIVSNLPSKERKTIDLDGQIYMIRLKNLLEESCDENSVFYNQLVGPYPDKKASYDYHKDHLQQLYDQKDKLRSNSFEHRVARSDSIIAEMRRMFEDMVGEKLNGV